MTRKRARWTGRREPVARRASTPFPAWLVGLALLLGSLACAPDRPDELHVHPGDSIQAALDAMADSGARGRVVVHAGTYRPEREGQALVWFNARHDGITLEAEGQVTLTAVNPDVVKSSRRGYPAAVNHVVYFGDGIGPGTVLRGVHITGANDFVTRKEADPPVQPEIDHPRLKKAQFFYTDGGGIKVFGRSYPTIERVVVHDNYASPCGAGVSVEHRGFTDQAVVFRDCIFRDNVSPLTGAGVDLLDHKLGSSAVFENCLFVGNRSNELMDDRARRLGQWKPRHGCGALTVFTHSKVRMDRCTFVGNRNGIDDSARGNSYTRSIFWANTLAGGWPMGGRYELDLADGGGVSDCFIGGGLADLNGVLDGERNDLAAPDPDFDEAFRPRNPAYADVGYRPVAP